MNKEVENELYEKYIGKLEKKFNQDSQKLLPQYIKLSDDRTKVLNTTIKNFFRAIILKNAKVTNINILLHYIYTHLHKVKNSSNVSAHLEKMNKLYKSEYVTLEEFKILSENIIYLFLLKQRFEFSLAVSWENYKNKQIAKDEEAKFSNLVEKIMLINPNILTIGFNAISKINFFDEFDKYIINELKKIKANGIPSYNEQNEILIKLDDNISKKYFEENILKNAASEYRISEQKHLNTGDKTVIKIKAKKLKKDLIPDLVKKNPHLSYKELSKKEGIKYSYIKKVMSELSTKSHCEQKK